MSTPRRSSRRTRSVRFVLVAGVTVMAMFSSAFIALVDTSSASADTTTNLPTAPAGFTDQVVAVYQSEYSTAQAVGRAGGLMPVDQYQQQVAQLPSDQLAVLYSATQQNPEWVQIPALMQTVAAGLSSGTATAALQSATVGAAASSVHLMSAYTTASTGTTSATLLATPVAPFTPATCEDGPPSAAIFAMQIVIDVSQAVYNVAAAFLSAGIGVAVVGIVAAAVLLAAQIVHDVLTFLQTLSDDCNANNSSGYIANIDNSTTQAFNLTTSIETSIAQLHATGATTLTDVQNLQTSLVTVEQALQQSLDSDTRTLQSTIGSSAQGLTTQMQTIQTALQQNLVTIQAAQNTNNQQVITEIDKGTAAVQASVSASLTQILHEVDTTAVGLTNLVTQGNQQILNTLQANFATGQNEVNANLKLDIELALASGIPQDQFKLPVSMGGYLNSTPVGVQEVVNDDLHALQALKVTIQPSTVNLVNAGNAALTAGQYLSAFANFMKAYQAFDGA
jgi:hypothetical protein